MELNNKNAEIYIPDNMASEKALSRTTHMTIAAHQDDIEIMAYDGIVKCFRSEDLWHCGIVVTNGAGSPRNGKYGDYTDKMMMKVRRTEQKKAAYVGEYGTMAMLDYPSAVVKDPDNTSLSDELVKIIIKARPKVIYTHNFADKHDTHVAVAVKTIKAIRKLKQDEMPKKVYGCEVWRDLDWINDDEKVMFDVSAHPNLASSLVELFDSQVIGGKRYDLAAIGRRLTNATFCATHATDTTNAISYAMDLTPLIINKELDIADYVMGYIDRFKQDVVGKIEKFS